MDEPALEFFVKGSAKEPYRVTFLGQGPGLQAFCTCPAGRMAGKFGKHSASLLKGNTAHLLDSPSTLEELAARAQGSPLVAKAGAHKAAIPHPQQIELGNISTFKDLADYAKDKLAGLDWWCEYTTGDDDAEFIAIYMRKYYKNGKPYKKPTTLLSISYEPFSRKLMYDDEAGDIIWSEPTARVMPYIMGGINYGKFSSAASKFIIGLDALLAEKNK